MQIFSILQQNLLLQFPAIADEPAKWQAIEFSHDPDDSSIVRMRVGPMSDASEPAPDGSSALEVTFDRNGKSRSVRSWPVKYPAWDKREPDDIDAEIIARLAEPAVDPTSGDTSDDTSEPDAEAAKTMARGSGFLPDVPENKFRRK